MFTVPRIEYGWMGSSGTYSEGIGLLPGYGRPPGVEPHLVRQGLGHGEQDEADVDQGDQRRDQNHQVVSIPCRQIGPDGRAGHQASGERGGHLPPMAE